MGQIRGEVLGLDHLGRSTQGLHGVAVVAGHGQLALRHTGLKIRHDGRTVESAVLAGVPLDGHLTQRLDRAWLFRRLIIGGAGLLGGVIAVTQIMATNLLGRIESLSLGTEPHLLPKLVRSVEAHLVLPSLPFGGEGLWMSAGLAGLALVFALTRAIEEY